MKKTTRFKVIPRTNRNIPPKFGLNNKTLQARRRVLKHRGRNQSPRRASLQRYHDNRPEGDEDILESPMHTRRIHDNFKK